MPSLFKICHNVGLRLPTSSSQGEILCPNPKMTNQYVLNVKYDLNYMQGETYTSLDEHARAWLHLILHVVLPIFSKKLGGKQRGIPSNTWFNSNC